MNAASAVSSTIPARPSVSFLALNRFAWGVLAYNIAVIVWGAAVRATRSGAGCGNHWPLCGGSPTLGRLIEFAHRASSGVALLAVIGLLVWTFRVTPQRHLARSASVAALVLTLNEALLGALLVLLGKVANDQSASRALYLGLHLTNTLLLLAALALTAHFISRQQGFMHGSVELRRPGIAFTGLLAMLIVGVSGSLAALADTLFPATSLRAAFLQDFSSQSSWIIRLRWIHPALSLVAGAFLLWLAFRGARINMHRSLSLTVGALLLGQIALGIGDIVLLTPTTMQLLHLLGADLLWVAVVVLLARLCLPPIGCTGGLCSRS
ncbi:MAG: COX15/CtaA family protein [Silvibacterium sp.]|nr:COX15/CtaA family protein [Silvibacterium sp.]